MDNRKRKKLEAAGWRVGDAADFLGLSDAEMRLVELRIEIGRAIRRGREARNLTQKQLADLMKTSQPRVAKIEAASSDVSLDLMLRGFFAVGGRLSATLEPSMPMTGDPTPGPGAVRGRAGPRVANALETSALTVREHEKGAAAKPASTPGKRPRKVTGSRS